MIKFIIRGQMDMLTSFLLASFLAAGPQPPSSGAASAAAQPSTAGPETIKPRPIRVIIAPPPSMTNNCEAAPKAQVRNLPCSEAADLIRLLKQAQAQLESGKLLYFELLSGGVASSPMTKVSPREVFTKMRFDEATVIERVRTENRLWQPYKLSYATASRGIAPMGSVEFVWDMEVVRGFTGRIERVQMVAKPPAPF